MRTCFFIGHRNTDGAILPALEEAVERHIAEYGVREFYVGQYGRFDALALRTVRQAKRRHPQVKLTLLLPYHPAQRPVTPPDGVDATFYPPGLESVPPRLAIVRANRYMVDCCDHLIACAYHPGNARTLLEYARGKGGIRIENLR